MLLFLYVSMIGMISLGTKGMGNVPIPGRCGCYREKIRYADGTFCSSSNRSWK